jgi:hypothetical protein
MENFRQFLENHPPRRRCTSLSTLHVKSLDQMRKGTQTNGKGLVGSGPSFPQNYDAVTCSHLSNKLGGWNKRGGGAKIAKSKNVEVFLWRGEFFKIGNWYAHAPKVNKLTPCHSRHKISRVKFPKKIFHGISSHGISVIIEQNIG